MHTKMEIPSSWLMAHGHTRTLAHSLAFTINGSTGKKYGPIFRHIYLRIAFSLSVLSHDTARNESKRVLTVHYVIMTNSICVLVNEWFPLFNCISNLVLAISSLPRRRRNPKPKQTQAQHIAGNNGDAVVNWQEIAATVKCSSKNTTI